MNFKPRIDLQSSDNSFYESVFVEIMRLHGKNIIVGCLYIPPDASLNDFNRSVEDILSAISFENKLFSPREAPIREVYNLVARESRVYHSSIARPA